MELKGHESPGILSLSTTRIFEELFFLDTVSPPIQALERIISEIAATDIPVLLVGESGSGKEVVAQRIHRISPRRDEPFFKLVCTTLAPEALEQHLVGDAGTGLHESLATAGTVFFDEVSDLNPACQPKLLQALPDGDSSANGQSLRARVISATGRNLEEEVRNGRFREQLYYRLNGVCLRLPPLRNRRQDIPGLLEFFLKRYSGLFGRPKPSLSPRTLSILVEYSWPGNIRELENTVKKIIAVGDERLALADLGSPLSEPQPAGGMDEKPSLKQAARAASRLAERELILEALARTHWNRKRAAKDLQISYKALLYKLKQMGLDDSASP